MDEVGRWDVNRLSLGPTPMFDTDQGLDPVRVYTTPMDPIRCEAGCTT